MIDRNGNVIYDPKDMVHEVLVTRDRIAPPHRQWLAVCRCEQGETTPQASRLDAVDDGWRHLTAHGVEPTTPGAIEVADDA